jgi:hypothetical protein
MDLGADIFEAWYPQLQQNQRFLKDTKTVTVRIKKNISGPCLNQYFLCLNLVRSGVEFLNLIRIYTQISQSLCQSIRSLLSL